MLNTQNKIIKNTKLGGGDGPRLKIIVSLSPVKLKFFFYYISTGLLKIFEKEQAS